MLRDWAVVLSGEGAAHEQLGCVRENGWFGRIGFERWTGHFSVDIQLAGSI